MANDDKQHEWIRPGAVVDYHAVIGGPVTDRGRVVASGPERLGGGQWVAWLDGKPGCVAVEALMPHDPPAAPPRLAADLQRRLDEIGGVISCACVGHVWSVVLTVDGVPAARRQHEDLLAALDAVATQVEEVRRGALP